MSAIAEVGRKHRCLMPGHLKRTSRSVLAQEPRHARGDLATKPRTVEDTVVADRGALEVDLPRRRNPGAQIQRCTALTGAGDVVFFALDCHDRRTTDRTEVDHSTSRGHLTAGQEMFYEHPL